jgi:hypothetical protein
MPRATARFEILNYFGSGYPNTEQSVWTSAVIFAKEMAANPTLFPEDLCLGEDLYAWCLLGLISPCLGWTPRVTSAYVCAEPVVYPGNRDPTAYVSRILADFPALAHPNNLRIRQHIKLFLMDHLERGDAQGLSRFLQRHHQAMPFWFRSVWWLLAGGLSVAGTTATVRLVQLLLHGRRSRADGLLPASKT